ncbi:MAG TPA: tetratricopeptide repeat protein [Chthonomonadales bacterium]|nr:tetratricopeptide repeat protein [Chthonomonadales bacterium]
MHQRNSRGRIQGLPYPHLLTPWLLLGSALVVIGLVSCTTKAPTPRTDRAAAEHFVAESRSLFGQKRIQETLETLSKAKEADPSWAQPHILRAELLRRLGRYREGWEELQAARHLAPNDPDITLTMLRNAPPTVPAAEMEALARKAVEMMPESAEAHYYLGYAISLYTDPKRYPEAIQAYQRAIQLRPEQMLSYLELGRLYHVMGESNRAIAALEGAWEVSEMHAQRLGDVPLELARTRRDITFWLAQAYQQAGRTASYRKTTALATSLSEKVRELEKRHARTSAAAR